MSLTCPISPSVALHPHVSPVGQLLGLWSGSGRGSYPTITPFDYEEELHFQSSNKIFVSYTQRTWLSGSERMKPMHEENGFFRFLPDHRIECLITQCTGVQETLLGSYTKDETAQTITITLDSNGITRVPSAKQPHVTQTRRIYTFDLDGETLKYQILMSTTTTPELTLHLEGDHTRPTPKCVAEEDEEEEEELEDKYLEPDATRHAEHNHSRAHSPNCK